MDVTIVLDTGAAPGIAPLTSAIQFNVVDLGAGTATGGGTDYTFTTTPLQFNISDDTGATRTVSVTIVPDPLDEDNETVVIELEEVTPGGVNAAAASHTVTITDNDAAPSVAIGNAGTVAEGSTASFLVSLGAASGKTVSVDYDTANGTAVQPGDYDLTSGTVTFNPGETGKTVTVDTNTDGLIEGNETFTVELSAPVNTTIVDGSGLATIQDATTVPAISIANAGTVAEGGTASFAVTLSSSLSQTVTVLYTTVDGSATAPADYTAKTGMLTFVAGDTEETVTVVTKTDGLLELAESFTVTLNTPTNATIADGSGSATISDATVTPTVSIADAPAVARGRNRVFRCDTLVGVGSDGDGQLRHRQRVGGGPR